MGIYGGLYVKVFIGFYGCLWMSMDIIFNH